MGQIKPLQPHRRVGKWGQFKPSYRSQINLSQSMQIDWAVARGQHQLHLLSYTTRYGRRLAARS
ncbi:hypothetical protein AWC31_31335 [Mycolicibacterium wolinskyi]|uniref:Uncharacterized protein n=1 Tax=Mycolicibacterium wolinskyi TaxID=59750 RepID=A0A1X2F222_9MYCO|nr:hypothetical protein AWC31_31335 [Mycolicibacterium wolinskyi]